MYQTHDSSVSCGISVLSHFIALIACILCFLVNNPSALSMIECCTKLDSIQYVYTVYSKILDTPVVAFLVKNQYQNAQFLHSTTVPMNFGGMS